MLIGQLSKRTGLSRDTIRYYEKQGLIPEGTKESQFNNYKNYSEKSLQQLLRIQKLKGFGLTLKEISEFLELLEVHGVSCMNVADKMTEKVRLIDQKIAELRAMKKIIIQNMNSCLAEKTEDEDCHLIAVSSLRPK